MLKSKYLRGFIGAIFLETAVIFLGVTQSWWDLTFAFWGIMGLITIIPAVLWILFFGTNIFNSLLFFSGFGYILYEQGFIDKTHINEYIIALTLFSIGLTVVGSMGTRPEDIDVFLKKPKEINQIEVKASAFLIQKHISSNYDGITKCNFSSGCTKLGVTLSNAGFEKDAVISLKATFGKIKIILPENVNVIINSNSTLGKVINNLKKADTETAINIKINAQIKFAKIILITAPLMEKQ